MRSRLEVQCVQLVASRPAFRAYNARKIAVQSLKIIVVAKLETKRLIFRHDRRERRLGSAGEARGAIMFAHIGACVDS